MRARVLLVALALVTLAVSTLSPASAGATPPQHTRVISSCAHARYKPSHYILACGDANIGLKHAKYSAWHLKTARGTGTYWFNDCTPNCASGTVHHQSATFKLYRPVASAHHGALFTRIMVKANGNKHHYHLPKRTA